MAMVEKNAADVLIRAGAVYPRATSAAARAVALSGDRIAAISADPHGLDASIGARTHVVDDPTLAVLPAFYDTHCHLRELARNRRLVPVERARNLGELVALVRAEAERTPPGAW